MDIKKCVILTVKVSFFLPVFNIDLMITSFNYEFDISITRNMLFLSSHHIVAISKQLYLV